jgi:hypothetical protein
MYLCVHICVDFIYMNAYIRKTHRTHEQNHKSARTCKHFQLIMHPHTHIQTSYLHTHTHAHIQTSYLHTHTHTYIHTSTHTQTHTHTHKHYVHTHTHTNTKHHVHTHSHTHTHIHHINTHNHAHKHAYSILPKALRRTPRLRLRTRPRVTPHIHTGQIFFQFAPISRQFHAKPAAQSAEQFQQHCNGSWQP